MKKIAIFTLALVLVFALSACGNAKPTQIGDSDFSLVLPNGYKAVDDDFSEDQIAYFYKDDKSIDFDVYQWEKGDEYTLASEASYYAAEYGTVAEAVTINGIHGMKYVSEGEYEGVVYTVLNYIFEDDVYLVELCFWTNASAAEYAVVEEILNTLKLN